MTSQPGAHLRCYDDNVTSHDPRGVSPSSNVPTDCEYRLSSPTTPVTAMTCENVSWPALQSASDDMLLFKYNRYGPWTSVCFEYQYELFLTLFYLILLWYILNCLIFAVLVRVIRHTEVHWIVLVFVEKCHISLTSVRNCFLAATTTTAAGGRDG